MTSRSWQMLAAFASLGVMAFVLVKYGLHNEHAPPTAKPADEQPHAGAQHHTAEPHQGDTLAPLQVYANAKTGDWQAYETTTVLAGGTPRKTMNLRVLDGVDDNQVTVSQRERENSTTPPDVHQAQLPRRGLTIDQLAGNTAGNLDGLAISDDTHEVGGRSFACKKLAFSLRDPLKPDMQASVEMWISDEVPAGGLVELHERFAATQLEITQKLVGFGDAKSTAWGQKPADL